MRWATLLRMGLSWIDGMGLSWIDGTAADESGPPHPIHFSLLRLLLVKNGMNPTTQVMNQSFVQASYNNSNLQACSFFMPSTLPDGSTVSAFSIRPIGLDG